MFAKRVFLDVSKNLGMRSEWALNPGTSVLIDTLRGKDRRRHHVMLEQRLEQCVTSQGTQGTHKREKAGWRPP